MKNVKSSQTSISLNFCTEFSKGPKFLHVSIAKVSCKTFTDKF